MKRFLIVTGAVALTVVLASVIVIRFYVRSSRVTEQVTTQLEAMYGGPVRVGSVDVGLTGTTINHFALYEEGSTDDDLGEPWLKVESISSDVSLWDVLKGNSMPKRVTLTGARLMLRFDRAGNLITNFPPPSSASTTTVKWELTPEINIEQGEVVFRKEGLADLVVKNVNVRVARKANAIAVTGKADSAELGNLTLTGSLDEKSGLATVRLKNEAKVHVTQDTLDRIPFVPASVWDEIQIGASDTTARLTLTADLNQRSLCYRIELSPENTRFVVPSIGLSAERASGRVIIDDHVVMLRNVRGQAFGGQFGANADLDFQPSITRLTFGDITVENLNADELPAQWRIPVGLGKPNVHRKLDGNASMEVTIATDRITPTFAAEILALAGTPFAVPEMALFAPDAGRQIAIKGQGKGRLHDPRGRYQPVEFDWQLGRGR
jgi:hypothetical protein